MLIDDLDLKELENAFAKTLTPNLAVEELDHHHDDDSSGDDDSSSSSGSTHNHDHSHKHLHILEM